MKKKNRISGNRTIGNRVKGDFFLNNFFICRYNHYCFRVFIMSKKRGFLLGTFRNFTFTLISFFVQAVMVVPRRTFYKKKSSLVKTALVEISLVETYLFNKVLMMHRRACEGWLEARGLAAWIHYWVCNRKHFYIK